MFSNKFEEQELSTFYKLQQNDIINFDFNRKYLHWEEQIRNNIEEYKIAGYPVPFQDTIQKRCQTLKNQNLTNFKESQSNNFLKNIKNVNSQKMKILNKDNSSKGSQELHNNDCSSNKQPRYYKLDQYIRNKHFGQFKYSQLHSLRQKFQNQTGTTFRQINTFQEHQDLLILQSNQNIDKYNKQKKLNIKLQKIISKQKKTSINQKYIKLKSQQKLNINPSLPNLRLPLTNKKQKKFKYSKRYTAKWIVKDIHKKLSQKLLQKNVVGKIQDQNKFNEQLVSIINMNSTKYDKNVLKWNQKVNKYYKQIFKLYNGSKGTKCYRI